MNKSVAVAVAVAGLYFCVCFLLNFSGIELDEA